MSTDPRADAPDQMPHVLVVDDDQRLRALLRRFLAENGFLVTTADGAADARAKLRNLSFDVLVLDVMMPGEDGFALTRSLRETSTIPILLLTAMDEVEHRITGLEGGADDYLAKPFEPRELLLRLGNIIRRTSAATPPARLVRFGSFTFDPASMELSDGEHAVGLTSGETGLLSILSERPGEVVTREEIGGRQNLGSRAIDVQVTRLRRKIESSPRNPRYLITVRGTGYVLRAN